MIYSINATMTYYTNDKFGVSTHITRNVPTFYLDSDIQGIVSREHAVEIAKLILNPFNLDRIEVSVTACKI